MKPNNKNPVFFFRGRVALHAILRSLGIGPGSTVLLQAFTCTAVPEAIMTLGAKPKYVDIGENGINMCPSALQCTLETGGDAVIVQHTFGIPAPVETISNICKARRIPMIEDCCHVLGFPNDGGLGSLGAASFYSFEWGKPIPVGIGGAALGNSEWIEKELRSIAGKLLSPPAVRQIRLEAQYYFYRLFYSPKHYWLLKKLFKSLSRANIAEGNFHLSYAGQVSAEFGWTISRPVLARIRKAEERLAERREKMIEVVREYREGIRNEALRHLVNRGDGRARVLARYPLMTDQKKELLAAAERYNVEVAGWYISPIHPLHGRSLDSVQYSAGSCPNAEAAAEQIVSLPVQNAGEKDIERIIRFLNGDW
jgi:dTDP-4-amino-4,6-dideoxygalactose transaminase